ncbi:MAG: translation initiation factor IF-3 [Parcubacteria group bacterium Gr01-1014_30]|nr:MAG: translation initiation factor IF-3 [Parcubacteria group bacterium Gr01-1014_30]
MLKKPLVNRQIKAKELRLIDETGKQLGVVSFEEAANIAIERKLDLIQVTEKVEPPVCKLMDYGKYLYTLQKKEKATRPKHTGELKGIRLSFNISAHDLEIRAQQAEKFLKKGDKVRVELPLRGREKAFGDQGKEKIRQFLEMLGKVVPVKTERDLKREPRGFTIIISKQ